MNKTFLLGKADLIENAVYVGSPAQIPECLKDSVEISPDRKSLLAHSIKGTVSHTFPVLLQYEPADRETSIKLTYTADGITHTPMYSVTVLPVAEDIHYDIHSQKCYRVTKYRAALVSEELPELDFGSQSFSFHIPETEWETTTKYRSAFPFRGKVGESVWLEYEREHIVILPLEDFADYFVYDVNDGHYIATFKNYINHELFK